jgi:hypothetical protein
MTTPGVKRSIAADTGPTKASSASLAYWFIVTTRYTFHWPVVGSLPDDPYPRHTNFGGPTTTAGGVIGADTLVLTRKPGTVDAAQARR